MFLIKMLLSGNDHFPYDIITIQRVCREKGTAPVPCGKQVCQMLSGVLGSVVYLLYLGRL